MKLLVALLVSTLLVHSLLADGSRRGKEAAAAALGYSNATVYDMSVAKCAGCGALGAWAESLEFLYYHNLVRLARWELPLAWSPRLESYARWWAAQRRGDCALRHSFPEGQFALGENIFWGGVGGAWRPGDAVKDWAAEGVDYSYAANATPVRHEDTEQNGYIWMISF
ncbi:hypothetical protein OsI_09214 [Oryza sativa Indica Group]|uniref:SCP domain-containing protein n=1 Tax=Oryza sativa subsp. indica TaxID=39946 RepID=A2XAD4_ORYSI|nr:hypothetical protein OsI_09214 [Oryza sativa Indica Group]